MTQLDGQDWGVRDAAELVAGIDRDLAELEAQSADRIRKGRLTRQEAEYLAGLIGDIREDLLFAFSPVTRGERLQPRVTWRDKVRWIDRELELRRRLPELVAKGRLTAEQAQRKISMIEQLRRLYWNKLFQWQPPAGPAADYLIALRRTAKAGGDATALYSSEGAKIYRELVRRHLAAVELEAQPQGDLVA